MRPKGTKEELEARRRLAVALRKKGLTTRQVAEQIGCVPSSVTRWTQAFTEKGPSGLDPLPQGGSRPKLTEAQRKTLVSLLTQGARKAGFSTELWTLPRIQQVILREFGVQYHVGHLSRVMHDLGFSPQKPERRAREQDEKAVEKFRIQTWARVKKMPRQSAEPSS